MKMPSFTYHQPASVGEAVELLAGLNASGADAKVLAGGQSLLPVMALRLGPPSDLIDIGRISGLGDITVDDAGQVTIGAMVRHGAAEDSAVVATHAPLVAAALPHIGHRAIRSLGTVCGSLAHGDPAAEMPAVAVALDAEFTAVSTAGARTIAASDFFRGYLDTALEPGELLTSVRFGATPPRTGATVVELSRRHGDYAMVGLACTLSLDADGHVAAARLVFFGTGATPDRCVDAEHSLVGATPTAEAFDRAATLVMSELDPGGDNHASAAYRRHGAGVLTRRGLAQCLQLAVSEGGPR